MGDKSSMRWIVLLAALALLLPGCGGGGGDGGSPPPSTVPTVATNFSFTLPLFEPSDGTPPSSGGSQPLGTGGATISGQFWIISDSTGEGLPFDFALEVDETTLEVLIGFDLNLPTGVYNFYVLLHNTPENTTPAISRGYGGSDDGTRDGGGTLIVSGGLNQVYITLYPAIGFAPGEVRQLRGLAPAPLSYDPTSVGTTRPRLTLTLASGVLVYLVNPDPAIPLPQILLPSGDTPPQVQFFYGGITAPVLDILTNDPTPLLEYTIDDPCFAAGTCGEIVLVDGQVTTARNGDELPTGLNDGTHTVRVIFINADNVTTEIVITITVDATPPDVTIVDPGSGGTTGEEPIQDGGTIRTDTGTGSGDLTISTDETGTATIYLDPDTTCVEAINAGGDLAVVCAAFKISSVVIDDITQTITTTIASLSLGPHTIYIVTVDDLGNQSKGDEVTVVSFTVVTDDAPEVAISEPQKITYDTSTVPFAFTATDDFTDPANLVVSIVVERFDDATKTWLPDSSAVVTSTQITLAQDGRYRVVVSVTDEALNTSTVHRKFSVDTTPPGVVIQSPVDGSTVFTGKPRLVVLATEQSEFNVQIFLFAGPLRPYDSTDLLGIDIDGLLQQPNRDPLTDGVYTVVVELTDAVGLTGSDHSTFTVDATGPFVDILNPAEGDIISNGKVNLKYNAHNASQVEVWVRRDGDSEPASPLLVRLIDPVQPIPRTYEEILDLPIDGSYTITLVAVDVGSAHPPAEDSVGFIVDDEEPDVDIITPDDEFFLPGFVPLEFQASNATSYRVLLDGTLVEEGSLAASPVTVVSTLGPFASDGTHTVEVSVSNGTRSESESEEFVIDGTAPVVTILAPKLNQSIPNSSITVVYTIEEANEIESETVSLDDVILPGVESGDTLRGLTLGTHTIDVQATDEAGNESAIASVTFFIEDSEPDHGDHRKGKSSCFRDLLPIAGDEDKLDDLLECTRSPNSPQS